MEVEAEAESLLGPEAEAEVEAPATEVAEAEATRLVHLIQVF